MYSIITTASVLIILIQSLFCQSKEIIKTKNLNKTRISFGSCNKFYQDFESDIFERIVKKDYDVFAWLGDAAYVDKMWPPNIYNPEFDDEVIKWKFNQTKYDTHYQKLLKQMEIIGVWDDHDYNLNDGGKDNPTKHKIREYYLDFLDEPKNSPRRTNPNGIYESYYIGENKRVKMIMLDVRFSREEKHSGNPQDILGEAQWKWLEGELIDSKPVLFIIGSGSQIIPDDRVIFENWYQHSKTRLFSMIKKLKKSVLLISGDLHIGEIMRYPCDLQELGYELYEVTSSGLSFTNNDLYYLIPGWKYFHPLFFPNVFSQQEDRLDAKNYGAIEIEWNEQNISQSKINLFVYGNEHNNPMLYRNITLFQISYNETNTKIKYDNNSLCHYIKNNTHKDRATSHFIQMILNRNWNQIFILFIFVTLVFTIILIAVFILYYFIKKCLFSNKKIDNLSNKNKKEKVN